MFGLKGIVANMLYDALSFLAAQLSAFVRLKDPLQTAGGAGPWVTLSNIVDQENRIVPQNDGIILTLVNTEEETVGKAQLPYFKTPDDRLHVENPDIKINLYLLLSAHATSDSGGGSGWSGYEKQLRLLDEVLLFFQHRAVFKATDHIALRQAHIEQLMLDHVSLTFEQQNHLWATLGAKLMPSVMYKCRMLTVRQTLVSREAPPVIDFETQNLSI